MSEAVSEAEAALARLLEVMRRLRDPIDGCPWDLVQTHATIAPYTIEEAYEAEDAILRGDSADLRDELGDVLLQVVFQAQIAHEDRRFDFAGVADAIAAKMIRRHPHIFAESPEVGAGPESWEAIKARERAAKSDAEAAPSCALDGVARTLPTLVHAYKLQRRAARIGFDFPDWHEALAKTHEELLEVVKAESKGADATEDEIGDLLFAAINLARKLDVDPDAALKRTNAKFERRFKAMEAMLRAAGADPAAA
ncbi:MAG: nucleoside triphosphate pyrophosphohydrolase, partial [Alphaproteobacteria bacterium]